MKNSNMVSEAIRWIIELETADKLEDVWPAFDSWFQSSAEHRQAYAIARKARVATANAAILPASR